MTRHQHLSDEEILALQGWRLNPDNHVAAIFPAQYFTALVHAGRGRDLRSINRLTDELAVLGYCARRAPDNLGDELALSRGL